MQCACRGGCLRIGLILLVWYIDITATVFAAQAASQHLKFALNASRFLCVPRCGFFGRKRFALINTVWHNAKNNKAGTVQDQLLDQMVTTLLTFHWITTSVAE